MVIAQVMSTELRLDLPWVTPTGQRVGDLLIRRGHHDVLSYDDGITLQVRVLNPVRYGFVCAKPSRLQAARSCEAPALYHPLYATYHPLRRLTLHYPRNSARNDRYAAGKRMVSGANEWEVQSNEW